MSDWYINDHTIIYGPGSTWHMIGITHSESADPGFEVNLAHAVSTNGLFGNWMKEPFALGAQLPETHLWAPHIIFHDNLWHMFYCGGGDDRANYLLNEAVSTDLWNWKRLGTVFTGGVDGRDPMVLNLGSKVKDFVFKM